MTPSVASDAEAGLQHVFGMTSPPEAAQISRHITLDCTSNTEENLRITYDRLLARLHVPGADGGQGGGIAVVAQGRDVHAGDLAA